MTGFRLPVVGHQYCVLCPVCSNTVSFSCQSANIYGVKCYLCHTHINLQNPSEPLTPDDPGVLPKHSFDDSVSSRGVRYSMEVRESSGGSASAQVAMLISKMTKEQRHIMSKGPYSEVQEVFSARRIQAISDKIWFLHPLVYCVEYLFFGDKPVAEVGNVRLFRREFPVVGHFYIPVVKTSTSSAVPLTIIIVFTGVLTYITHVVGEPHLWHNMKLIFMLFLPLCGSLWATVYSDPGYAQPTFPSVPSLAADGPSPWEVEGGVQQERESSWEDVNGQSVERRWCSACGIHRPLRAAHCYFCGMCVNEQDHHCGVIGVCVGRRNIGMFLLFVLICIAAMVLTVTTAALVLRSCVSQNMGGMDAAAADSKGRGCKAMTPLLYALLVTTLVVAVFLLLGTLPLFVSVIAGVLTATTTRERLKHIYPSGRSPFDRGILRNAWDFITRGKPASIIDDRFVSQCLMQAEKADDFIL
ncbi:palmitoyl acyltransferase 4, putative [Trypanosoma equiperdum]|uniref:Palmitoyltransferase n=1 Tax=Trypanosoma equiperdum TaxID=5694 RepID=A0A1G4I1P2_TRYEQ|nr:palmitoyl acyltransferase 4, putative [Trypanosoma equiperdum]